MVGLDVLDSVAVDFDVRADGEVGEDVGAEVAEDVGAVVVEARAGLGTRTAALSGNAASRATAERLRSGRRGNVTVGVFRQRSEHVVSSTVTGAGGGVSTMPDASAVSERRSPLGKRKGHRSVSVVGAP
ncbi:MAG TPA: hypothetical protein VKB14_14940 [Actinomycetales bacterium]|nr:hypothetical protein [Actinomycetales bacterium]